MRFSPHLYAEALARAIDRETTERQPALIRQFVDTVAQRGDLGQGAAIIESFARTQTERAGGHFVEVAYAREPVQKERERVESCFSPQDYVVTRTDPSLVAGVRVTVDGTRELDVSLRGKLTKLFYQ